MIGVVLFTFIAFIFSILIVYLNGYLFNKDEKLSKLEEMLPGYNCGSCGFGSCKGMAEAILNDKEAVKKCRPLKDKEKILKYLGE